MRLFLKIKIMSLAEEARIIRRHERKLTGDIRWLSAHQKPVEARQEARATIHGHRVLEVRGEARVAHLAYGFLRGTALEVIEAKGSAKVDWKRVEKMAGRFGPVDGQAFKEWSGQKKPESAAAAA